MEYPKRCVYETIQRLIKMKILIYTQHIGQVNGVQTFEKNFCKAMSSNHQIYYLYQTSRDELHRQFEPYATVMQDGAFQDIEVDLCIYSSIQHSSVKANIKAKKYLQMVHTDLHAWGIAYSPSPHINTHICVGEEASQSLKQHFGIDSIVIPNIMSSPEITKVLRLVTASRITEGKGFDRIVEMARKLKMSGQKFIWEIYGDGAYGYIEDLKYQLTGIKEVMFLGAKDSIQSYMKGSDYLVQLSDNEGFCYSVHEALQIGIPCITTPFGRSVIKDGENGYVLEYDLSNLNIMKIVQNIPNKFIHSSFDAKVGWENIFKTIK